MTILEALQEVKEQTTGIKTLIFADLNEANATYTDKMVKSEYPILLILPFAPQDTISKTSKVKTSVELDLFFLTQSASASIDNKSVDIENECIAPMRLIARRFIHNLNHHSIVDPASQGIVNYNLIPAYSSLDANLYGVEVRVTVPVMEVDSACV